MRPPICEICNKDFNPSKEGGLLYFKGKPEGRAFEKRVKEEGIVGHPPDAGWFCVDRYKEAEKIVNLTLGEVIEELQG